MKITIPEPTTTITKGELGIEADDFEVETSMGTFKFYLRNDGSLAVFGYGLAISAQAMNSFALRITTEPTA